MCGWLVFNLHRSIYGLNPSNYWIVKKKKRLKINIKKKVIMVKQWGDEGKGRVLDSSGSSLK